MSESHGELFEIGTGLMILLFLGSWRSTLIVLISIPLSILTSIVVLYATLDQRLRALDLIRKRETNAAWKLMLAILPKGYDASDRSPMPRWRDFIFDSRLPDDGG